MSSDFHLYQKPEYLEKLKSDFSYELEQIEESFRHRIDKKKRRAKLLARIGLSFWIGAILVVAIGIMPQLAYSLFPQAADRVAGLIGETVQIEESSFGEQVYQVAEKPKPSYVPPFDPDLPEENRLIIKSIGVNTAIGEGEDWEEVLKDGVWRAPNFGTPEYKGIPTILAAHRFGYLSWTNEFRRTSSFYNLPKLVNGDIVEVIWGQRRYVYEVYEGYTSDKLEDFDADLILFTCQVLNSDQRIIRKARLIVPDDFASILKSV